MKLKAFLDEAILDYFKNEYDFDWKKQYAFRAGKYERTFAYCYRCGSKLTSPKSMNLGFGPKCLQKKSESSN